MYISGNSGQTWLPRLKSLHFHSDGLVLCVVFKVNNEICPLQSKESEVGPHAPTMVPPSLALSVIQRMQEMDFPSRKMFRAAGETWQVHASGT